MSDRLRSLIFALVLSMVCSVLLTLGSTGLKGYQLRNAAVDRQLNILKAVGLIDAGKSYSAEEIEKAFSLNMKSLWVDASGRIVGESEREEKDLPLYLFTKEGEVEAYVVPINTQGLWGRIEGYLAIDNDGSTIRGFTVYRHAETPGLGGEIERQWFQKNFQGKKIVNRTGEFVSIGVAKGRVSEVVPEPKRLHYVDGISGATLTGKFLTSGLKTILSEYEPVAVQFRKNPKEAVKP